MKGRVTPYKKVGNRVVAWRVFLELGEGPDGKRQRWTEVVRGTKVEAEAVRVRKEAEVLAGTFVPRHVVTVKEWLKLWLEDYAPLKATAGTVEGYTRMCERHLIPALGAIRLTELTPEAVQRFYRQQRDRGLAGRTVLHQHRVLNAALKRAVRVGRLARNPLDRVDAPKAEDHQPKAVDAADSVALLGELQGSELHLPALLALRTHAAYESTGPAILRRLTGASTRLLSPGRAAG
jgi:integrase